jgi:hypothetical protein
VRNNEIVNDSSSLIESCHEEKESGVSQAQILSLEHELEHELTNDKNQHNLFSWLITI